MSAIPSPERFVETARSTTPPPPASQHLGSPISAVAKSAIASAESVSANKRDVKFSIWAKISGGIALVITLVALASLNMSILAGGLILAVPFFSFWYLSYEQVPKKRAVAKVANQIDVDLEKINEFKTELNKIIQESASIQPVQFANAEKISKSEEDEVVRRAHQLIAIAESINTKWTQPRELSKISISFLSSFKAALDHLLAVRIGVIKNYLSDLNTIDDHDENRRILLDCINTEILFLVDIPTNKGALSKLETALSTSIDSLNKVKADSERLANS